MLTILRHSQSIRQQIYVLSCRISSLFDWPRRIPVRPFFRQMDSIEIFTIFPVDGLGAVS